MGRFGESLGALRRGPVGFKLHEVMTGHHEFEPGCGPPGRHPMVFRVDWGPRDVRAWLRRGTDTFLSQELEGRVTVGGLCDETPCLGALELRYFDERRIRYAFGFEVQGRAYRYVGEKVNIRVWNLPVSHTTCFGRLVEAETGRLVSTSVTHFRLRTAPRFLTSLRLRLRPGAGKAGEETGSAWRLVP